MVKFCSSDVVDYTFFTFDDVVKVSLSAALACTSKVAGSVLARYMAVFTTSFLKYLRKIQLIYWGIPILE